MIFRWGAVAEKERGTSGKFYLADESKAPWVQGRKNDTLAASFKGRGDLLYDPTHQDRRWGGPGEAVRGVALSTSCTGDLLRLAGSSWSSGAQRTKSPHKAGHGRWRQDFSPLQEEGRGKELARNTQSNYFQSWFGRLHREHKKPGPEHLVLPNLHRPSHAAETAMGSLCAYMWSKSCLKIQVTEQFQCQLHMCQTISCILYSIPPLKHWWWCIWVRPDQMATNFFSQTCWRRY